MSLQMDQRTVPPAALARFLKLALQHRLELADHQDALAYVQAIFGLETPLYPDQYQRAMDHMRSLLLTTQCLCELLEQTPLQRTELEELGEKLLSQLYTCREQVTMAEMLFATLLHLSQLKPLQPDRNSERIQALLDSLSHSTKDVLENTDRLRHQMRFYCHYTHLQLA